MKTALIISEYNPFHLGHKYQIEDIRAHFGDDTLIIALMSGNYTQRGEVAVADKFARAEAAVLSGINLVLLLPFPYSVSSAEFFATAGVEIANQIGVVDIIAFGSETGDVEKLSNIANNMLSDSFKNRLNELLSCPEYKSKGYPSLCELAYSDTFGDALDSSFFTPNNILAIEYLKALIISKSSIKPYTTKRIGADYNDEKINDSKLQSATAIRKLLNKNVNSASDYIPKNTKNVLTREFSQKRFPCDTDRLSPAVLSHFRLSSPTDSCNIHDADGGLYNRLIASSIKANSITNLTELASTKKYTAARIRRAIWYSFFGVTSSDIKTKPKYTQALAMDSLGQALLKRIKKTTDFPIITKPSADENLGKEALRQKEISDKADFIFELSRPFPSSADTQLKAKPFVKKDG